MPKLWAKLRLSSSICWYITLLGNILDQVSLCTYSTGQSMVREVLDDWFQFLGGHLERVIFTVSSSAETPPIYEE